MLYEPPGPAARKRIRVCTAIALLALAALLALVIRQFADTGQLSDRYWSFFGKASTWRFLGQGLLTTLEAAVTGALIAFSLGFVMMRGKLRKNRVIRWVSTALIEFTRGVPTLLFIYFFFLVVPQTGWKLSAFWKITLPTMKPLILLNSIYTVVTLATGGSNEIIELIYTATYTATQGYSYAMAMSWIYTLVVAVILVIVYLLLKEKSDRHVVYETKRPDMKGVQNAGRR